MTTPVTSNQFTLLVTWLTPKNGVFMANRPLDSQKIKVGQGLNMKGDTEIEEVAIISVDRSSPKSQELFAASQAYGMPDGEGLYKINIREKLVEKVIDLPKSEDLWVDFKLYKGVQIAFPKLQEIFIMKNFKTRVATLPFKIEVYLAENEIETSRHPIIFKDNLYFIDNESRLIKVDLPAALSAIREDVSEPVVLADQCSVYSEEVTEFAVDYHKRSLYYMNKSGEVFNNHSPVFKAVLDANNQVFRNLQVYKQLGIIASTDGGNNTTLTLFHLKTGFISTYDLENGENKENPVGLLKLFTLNHRLICLVARQFSFFDIFLVNRTHFEPVIQNQEVVKDMDNHSTSEVLISPGKKRKSVELLFAGYYTLHKIDVSF